MKQTFNAKDVFRRAKEEERKGDLNGASAKYALLVPFLLRRHKVKEAYHLIQRAIQLAPESSRLYVLLALCEMKLENTQKAAEAVVTFAKTALEKKKTERYSAFLESRLRDYPELHVTFYETLLEFDRTHAKFFIALARALIRLKKYEKAQRTLLDALKTKTEQEAVLDRLKQVLELRDRLPLWQHVIRFRDKKLSRKDLIVLLSTDSAKSSPTAINEPAPEEDKNLRVLIEELEASLGIQVGDGFESVEALVKEFRKRADQVLTGDSKTQMDMALAFYEMGLHADARDQLNFIASSDPLFAQAQMLLADILYQEGSLLAAMEIYQERLREDGVSDAIRQEAHYKLIQTFSKLNDWKQALFHVQALEKIAPGYRNLSLLLRQVEARVAWDRPNEARESHHSPANEPARGRKK